MSTPIGPAVAPTAIDLSLFTKLPLYTFELVIEWLVLMNGLPKAFFLRSVSRMNLPTTWQPSTKLKRTHE